MENIIYNKCKREASLGGKMVYNYINKRVQSTFYNYINLLI